MFNCITYDKENDWCTFSMYTMFWGLGHDAEFLCWDHNPDGGEHYIC